MQAWCCLSLIVVGNFILVNSEAGHAVLAPPGTQTEGPNDAPSGTGQLRSPERKFNRISRVPSVSNCPFPATDSWAYSHNEDFGFSIFLERRSKLIYFIRHAEAHHNVAERVHELGTLYLQEEHSGWQFHDAGLSPKGEEQCAKLKKELENMPHPLDCELVVVSPLMRTLQTARLTVGAVKMGDRRPTFLATDLCRERITNCPADSRRDLSVLKAEFPEVDFDLCLQTEKDEMWFEHKEDNQLCKERGLRFLQWLAKRPESRIAVVTHSGFLKRLFSQFGRGMEETDLEEIRRRPANCEMRGLVLCAHRHFSDVPGTEGYTETKVY